MERELGACNPRSRGRVYVRGTLCGLESLKKQLELVRDRACVRGTLCELENFKILIEF